MATDLAPIISVRDLNVEFRLRQGIVHAVKNVSFELRPGRTLGLVGESGSGKSVTARALMQLVDPPGYIASGAMMLGDTDIAKLGRRGPAIRALRGADISMIFQEPMSSLSPVHTIGSQIIEALRLHLKLGHADARKRAIELLQQVEIADAQRNIDRYTFEFSGGMRQRVMIAMALACNPRVLIADEPTTALDVTTQAEVLDLIRRIQRERGMAMLLITHDMGVVAEVADDIAVMYRGEIVEAGPVDQVFHQASHHYTQRLLSSVLKLEGTAELKAGPVAGAAPILSVKGLGKTYLVGAGAFGGRAKSSFRAVNDVSFQLGAGESLGIVGESGSGKTTLGRLIMRSVEPTDGEVVFSPDGAPAMDVRSLDRAGLRRYYEQVRFVFQDPFSSLNPRMSVREIVGEPLHVSGSLNGRALTTRVRELLDLVGLDPDVMGRYPHAFSGGQRQRIGIARALALEPKILIADEPTSALDVSIRSQILDLLLDLQRRLGLSYIMISHDIGVIRYFCDRVAVMRQGKIVEIGDAKTVCTAPSHPYTKALISAVPYPDPRTPRMSRREKYFENSA
ncbi:MAG: transporter ATP-binding protein [Devosia sp.]|uniref:ABC transporter ATP-binding protein n=1 Tax=Devosia sp. TaxID=1871048 RepID=UPI002607E7D8|nr:ABC transporter ATP-binding protein [Devosia sp.]MDB5588589.1 transporter ATP-binding protein [Devosia sp.]